MDEREGVKKLIKDAFRNWCEEFLYKSYEEGGFGYDSLKAEMSQYRDRNCISAILSTEADVQMHFGAHLFNYLNFTTPDDKKIKYSVHAEFKIFNDNRLRADLLVTKVVHQQRINQDEIWREALAVIEIKGQSYFKPYSTADFNNLVTKDFKKFDNLNSNLKDRPLAKFVLVYHENFESNKSFADTFPIDKNSDVELLIPQREW